MQENPHDFNIILLAVTDVILRSPCDNTDFPRVVLIHLCTGKIKTHWNQHNFESILRKIKE